MVMPFLLCFKWGIASNASTCGPIVVDDADLIQFALNLEFLEAEFFLIGATSAGFDQVAPKLARGNLGHIERRIIEEFGNQEVGHFRQVVIYN